MPPAIIKIQLSINIIGRYANFTALDRISKYPRLSKRFIFRETLQKSFHSRIVQILFLHVYVVRMLG